MTVHVCGRTIIIIIIIVTHTIKDVEKSKY